MGHVALLGDSILDNGAYVGNGPDVAVQLRQQLGPQWRVSLLAVDGNVTDDVASAQLPKLPADATHLVISVGGNDALRSSTVLEEPASSVAAALSRLAQAQDRFSQSYRRMAEAVRRQRIPTAVCTIYDANYPAPRGRLVVAGLALFNDVITRAAFANGLSLVDLRLICDEAGDYANAIEPSVQGGDKIARAIAAFVQSKRALPAPPQVWI